MGGAGGTGPVTFLACRFPQTPVSCTHHVLGHPDRLCEEAIRLGRLLVEHPATDRPVAHAALALMLLHAARLPARMRAAGDILLLADQDRSLWGELMYRLKAYAEGKHPGPHWTE